MIPITPLAACCLCFSVSVAAAQGIWLEQPPYAARVTTDTPEYCAHLLSRIGRVRARVEEPAQRADTLTAEGRRLCAHGHVRPGIARLRRALLLLEDSR
jgi:hypothetical protein